MEKVRSSSYIARRITEVESDAPRNLERAEQAVNSLIAAWPSSQGLYVQLQRLAEFIHKTKEELSSFKPADLKQHFIPKATDELDAIVEATASATHRIMDAADVIMAITDHMPAAQAAQATAAVTSIYEACTFQDITAQRVTKVVSTLKVIESRIDKMILGLDGMAPNSDGLQDMPTSERRSDQSSSQKDIDALFPAEVPKSVLEGPALPAHSRSQSEIDDLFNSID